MSKGIELIKAERQRQIEVEGWTPAHDATHKKGELARAAAVYALDEYARENYRVGFATAAIISLWPFSRDWFKPTPDDRIRELTKAGALIAAEIERLIDINPTPSNDLPDTGKEESPLVQLLEFLEATRLAVLDRYDKMPYDPYSPPLYMIRDEVDATYTMVIKKVKEFQKGDN